MEGLFNIFLIAVALSMDTFSLSLGLGTYNIHKRKCLLISLVVGIMHFLMPFLGSIVGRQLVQFFSLNHNLFLGGILLFIAGNLFFEMLKKDEEVSLDLSFLGIFLFSFGVSIDAFSTGLGLSFMTEQKIVAMLLFSIISFLFTLAGLYLGKFFSLKLGKKANLIGFFLLFYLGIHHLFK